MRLSDEDIDYLYGTSTMAGCTAAALWAYREVSGLPGALITCQGDIDYLLDNPADREECREAVRAMRVLSRGLGDMRKRLLEGDGCAPAVDLPERLEAVA